MNIATGVRAKDASKSVLLTGATGMIGGLVLQRCLERPDVARVVSMGRRRTGQDHDKLVEVEVAELDRVGSELDADAASMDEHLRGHDAAFFCMGVYTGQVSNEELHRLTADVPLRFAEALIAQSSTVRFALLSGQGADRRGRSRMAFARAKGAAEQGLVDLGFPEVLSFRPGYIYPVTPRREPNVSYRVFRALYPVLGRVMPNIGVPSDALARAMVEETLHAGPPRGDRIFENREIRRVAALA